VRATGELSLSTLISNLPGFAFRCLNDDAWTMVFISDDSLRTPPLV